MSAYPPEIAALRLTLEDLGPPASTLLAGVWRWRAPDSLAIALPGGRPLAEGRRALRGVRELLEMWLPGVDVAVVAVSPEEAARSEDVRRLLDRVVPKDFDADALMRKLRG